MTLGTGVAIGVAVVALLLAADGYELASRLLLIGLLVVAVVRGRRLRHP